MNKKYFGPLLIILAAFLWSLDGFLRQGLYVLPAQLIVFLEHFLGFIVVSPILLKRWRELKNLDKSVWFSIAWIALLGGVLGTFFYTKALSYVGYIDLSVVVLLQKLQPLFAIGLAMIILKERPQKSYWLWTVIALVGAYFITFKNGVPIFLQNGKEPLAALLAVGAAFAWGSSTVFGRKALSAVHSKLLTALRFGFTSLILVPFLFVHNVWQHIPQIQISQWQMLVAIVFSTGLVAVIIYYAGLKHTRASVATICELFWPLSAVLIDYFVNHTILTPLQIIGSIALLIAMYRISQNQKIVKAL